MSRRLSVFRRRSAAATVVVGVAVAAVVVGGALIPGGCAPFDSVPVECDDDKKLCFRGATLDDQETRARYGSAGQRAIRDYDRNWVRN